MVARAREKLEPSGASTVHVKLMILGASRFEGKDRARAVTDATDVGSADALNENGLMKGTNCSTGFEVVNKATLSPGPDEHATSSIVLSKAGW